MKDPYYISKEQDFYIVHDDCLQTMARMDFLFDMVFADPPYFLSNGGKTLRNGLVQSVDKGDWDKIDGRSIDDYNQSWLGSVRRLMKPEATIWISGTYHNIFSIERILRELNFKILNVVVWQKLNPPPNFSHRTFTHSAEYIIWARKDEGAKHYFDYELMCRVNGGVQMRDVWNMAAVAAWEKSCGRHPTQKPIPLLSRIISAATPSGAWVLDPFAGSSTSGIAANLLGRRFVGIEREAQYVELSRLRREELCDANIVAQYKEKLGL